MEVFLIFLSYVLHLYYNKHMDFFNNLIIFWSVNLFSIFLSQVIWFIVAVNQRLGAINFLLRNKKTITAHQLKIISKVHLKITKTIETMNESYCLIMMIFIGGSFCMFNLFLFHVKSFIFSSNAETLSFFLGKNLIHIYSFALTLMVIVVASRTPNEARRITRTLFEMIQKHEDEEEMNFQLFNLIQQISLSQNEFSCGLFIFNWKLCFKVKYSFNIFNVNFNEKFFSVSERQFDVLGYLNSVRIQPSCRIVKNNSYLF